jgi:hypothetical protein
MIWILTPYILFLEESGSRESQEYVVCSVDPNPRFDFLLSSRQIEHGE